MHKVLKQYEQTLHARAEDIRRDALLTAGRERDIRAEASAAQLELDRLREGYPQLLADIEAGLWPKEDSARVRARMTELRRLITETPARLDRLKLERMQFELDLRCINEALEDLQEVARHVARVAGNGRRDS